LRGRVGFAVDRLLIYATAGATWADLKLVGPGCGTCGNPTASGWTAGLGIDWAVSQTLVARFDWAHSNYGNFHYTQPTAFSATMVSDTFTIGLAHKF
jgi:outer membrane immunogenic protein